MMRMRRATLFLLFFLPILMMLLSGAAWGKSEYSYYCFKEGNKWYFSIFNSPWPEDEQIRFEGAGPTRRIGIFEQNVPSEIEKATDLTKVGDFELLTKLCHVYVASKNYGIDKMSINADLEARVKANIRVTDEDRLFKERVQDTETRVIDKIRALLAEYKGEEGKEKEEKERKEKEEQEQLKKERELREQKEKEEKERKEKEEQKQEQLKKEKELREQKEKEAQVQV
ncbi:MAG: hypothetical protein M1549_00305 [Candidatus Dependentiae bacterium]|nr:hypothetical protein [Candidatus Dependentiae bacterium]